MTEIEIIASFNDKGLVHPHRFRLTAEDESLLVVNIDRILYCDDNKRDGIVKYRCECVINSTKRIIDIYFNKVLMKWHLSI